MIFFKSTIKDNFEKQNVHFKPKPAPSTTYFISLSICENAYVICFHYIQTSTLLYLNHQ